jgi:hypothetical protein
VAQCLTLTLPHPTPQDREDAANFFAEFAEQIRSGKVTIAEMLQQDNRVLIVFASKDEKGPMITWTGNGRHT